MNQYVVIASHYEGDLLQIMGPYSYEQAKTIKEELETFERSLVTNGCAARYEVSELDNDLAELKNDRRRNTTGEN
jgi:hypothetical protein